MHTQHKVKQQANITSHQTKDRQINSEKFENSHFSTTKFAIPQTKLDKLYPNIKTIHFI
jgi:hypothetical protein